MPTEMGRIGPRGPGSPMGPARFRPTATQYGQRVIAGITQDNAGAVLGGCIVDLFVVGSNVWIAQVVSDAVTGAYSFPVATNDGTAYFVRCFKAGTPVFGTSDNTLVGSAP